MKELFYSLFLFDVVDYIIFRRMSIFVLVPGQIGAIKVEFTLILEQ